MAEVLHQDTLEYRTSVSPKNHPSPPWLYGIDMSAVKGVDRRYWILKGTTLTSMDAPARIAEDLRLLTISKDIQAAKLQDPEITTQALLDRINELRAKNQDPALTLDDIKTDYRGKI